MGGVGLAACALLLLCPLALTRHDDDFAFDNSDEFQVELAANHSQITKHGLRRLWGVPDTSAYVGHLFRMEIPKEAFAGDVLAYKVRSEEGRRMPNWMAIDSKHGLISGVPLEPDLGPHSFTVTAHGSTSTATDSFTIEVKKSSEKPLRYGSCGPHERRMVLAILLDTPFYRIAPWQKIKALMELAGFMNLEWDEFWMEPYKSESARDHSVLTSGPGTARARKGAATTAVYLNVGCGDKLWTRHKVLVAGIREQSRDGTLVHLLQQPVIGWRVLGIKPSPRTKRQSASPDSSGDYNYDDGGDEFSGGSYDDDDDDDYDQVGIVPDNDSAQNADNRSDHKVKIEAFPTASGSNNNEAKIEIPRFYSPVNIVPDDVQSTTELDAETVPSTSEKSSTIVGRTTETVTMTMPFNQPPTLKHHMKKLAVPAGKTFKYIIPAELFTDAEDGSNLEYSLYEADNLPLSPSSWIQFNAEDREVYGLPLESHVSRYNFIVEARDSAGATAKGPLDITVQQHKSRRTINHQFTLTFKLQRKFAKALDWQIRALEGIVNLFRDTDLDHLTVLNATQNGDVCELVWANDTLPRDSCPTDEINRLMKILQSDAESGSPSAGLARVMSPQLKVGHVEWKAVGKCAETPALKPATNSPDPFPPITRNQVDHITATTGHLLVYKVPEDTFFDPEDGGTRNLHLSLRYSDRSELSSEHWLQFDANNQEFYGLPLTNDEGSSQYQLVAEDSSKKSAYDSLIVEVVKAATIRPTVEFQMTMDYPYQSLAHNANVKRKVVEKLAALFGETETDAIRISSITDNPTTIVWYNTSLPMDRCPKKEIEDLHKLIIDEEKGLTGGALKENVDRIFDKDFKVMSIRLIPLGLCADNTKTRTSVPTHIGTNVQNSKGGATSTDMFSTEYLVTFVIPAVVIICMIIVAGIIACVLYRRRRTGKMSVGDEEERQAFRSKGIPVIFQDELEEQAATEPLHKSPVIMREEKPPLLPPAPDYRASAPYRPPPPMSSTTTPPRPKATPTYRKPPPYVPP